MATTADERIETSETLRAYGESWDWRVQSAELLQELRLPHPVEAIAVV